MTNIYRKRKKERKGDSEGNYYGSRQSLCSNFFQKVKKPTRDGKLGVFYQTFYAYKKLRYRSFASARVASRLLWELKGSVIIDLGNLESFTSHTWEINLEAAALTLWLHGGWLVSPVATRVSIFHILNTILCFFFYLKTNIFFIAKQTIVSH